MIFIKTPHLAQVLGVNDSYVRRQTSRNPNFPQPLWNQPFMAFDAEQVFWFVFREKGADAALAVLDIIDGLIDEEYRISQWRQERAYFDDFRQDVLRSEDVTC